MKPTLALRCDLKVDESLPSWISRLALHNGVETAREFCLDMGLTFQACVDGCPDALAKLTALTGTSIQTLEHACIKPAGTEYDVGGQRFARSMLRRSNVHVCPICIDQDLYGSHQAGEAAYGRLEWLLTVFRSCPYHHCAIVSLVQSTRPQTHDFALHMREANADIDCIEERIVPRRPSGLEAYVRARLANRPTGADWLDSLAMHAAITTCEMLGIVRTHGADVKTKTLSDQALHDAGRTGFDIARHGESAILELMADISRQHPYNRSGRQGPATVFGPFYRTMVTGRRADAFEPIRDLIREHVITTMPVGPGDQILGKPVERRVWHSLVTAARESNRHPMRLRKGLEAAGLLEPGHERLSDHFVLLDAERIAPFLETYARGLSANKAHKYMNCGPKQFELLTAHGYVRPYIVHRGGRDDDRATYAPADLDAFINHLRASAVPVQQTDLRRRTIPKAAKRLRCSSAEIVKHIINKQLRWVGCLDDVRGYLSLVVDVYELDALRNSTDVGGVPVNNAIKILRTAYYVMHGLIREGYFKRRTVRDPRAWKPYDVNERAELDKFNTTYISIYQLSKLHDVHHSRIMKEMANIKPAITKAQVGATFYRRDMIPKF